MALCIDVYGLTRVNANLAPEQADWFDARLTHVMVAGPATDPPVLTLAFTLTAGIVKLPGKVATSQPTLSDVQVERLMVVTCVGHPAVQVSRRLKLTVPPGIRLVVDGPA